ncbi:MAG: transcriptional repressor [Deltaproteobacteria bacterium]|jgi:Fur family ferric uptake transcriptional regulator|nr:transcriptional repressor [Deltaproteobacteria bacterium]
MQNNYLGSPEEKLAGYLSRKGMKLTSQRRLILAEFYRGTEHHLSAEDLYQKLRVLDSSIGQATVYRTLKLMRDAGLARELHFGDDVTRFEPYLNTIHHDHLICEECGKTVPVLDEHIERLQSELAEQHGFKLTSHRMYLYGICLECMEKK